MPADAAPPPESAPPRPAVYFTKLTLRNVRCFGNAEQELELALPKDGHAGWTVLLGDNGCGKTTVLECLALAYGTTREAPSHRSMVHRKSDDAEGRPALPSLGPVTLTTLNYRKDVLRVGTGDDEARVEVQIRLFCENEDPIDETAGFSTRYGVLIPVLIPDEVANVPAVVSVPASRSGRVRDDGRDSLIWNSSVFNPADWLRELDYSAAKAGPDDKQIHRRLYVATSLFQEVPGIRGLLPGVTDLRFTPPTRDGKPPQVQFKTPDGWVPLDRTAYGYQTLFVWVLDLVARLFEHYPDSDEPLKEPAVVLVDEIELHLHPKMQRDVLRYLNRTFPNVQFVVTTHSPLVAQAAPEVGANIAVLRRERDADGKLGPVMIDESAVAVRGWNVDQVLESDLFDTPPRPKAQQDALDERRAILRKPTLTPADTERLTELETALDIIPPGEGRAEVRDRGLLDDTLALLRTAVAEAEAERAANETPAEPPAPADDPAGRPAAAPVAAAPAA